MGEERRVKNLLDYWPLIVALGAGVTGYLQLKWTVADLRKDMDDFQINVQQHRGVQSEKDREEEHRFTAIEKDLEWLKKGRNGGG